MEKQTPEHLIIGRRSMKNGGAAELRIALYRSLHSSWYYIKIQLAEHSIEALYPHIASYLREHRCLMLSGKEDCIYSR